MVPGCMSIEIEAGYWTSKLFKMEIDEIMLLAYTVIYGLTVYYLFDAKAMACLARTKPQV